MADGGRGTGNAEVTRRRMLGWGAAGGAATMLMPSPWRAAFGEAKPYKIGTLQPLTGVAAAGGKPHSSAFRWRPTASTNWAASTAGRST